MSLRARLLALLVGLTAAGLLVVSAVSYAALSSYLSKRVDRQAVSALFDVSRELDDDDHHGPPGGPPPGQIPEGTYGALRDASGQVVAQKTLAFGTAQRAYPHIPADLPVNTGLDDPRTVDGHGYRFIAAAVPGGSL